MSKILPLVVLILTAKVSWHAPVQAMGLTVLSL